MDKYYSLVRREIFPLIPDKLSRVLGVGCGTGETLLWIKEIKQCTWIAGVEIVPDIAFIARKKLDAVYEGSIEQIELPIEDSSLDLILCLDVLEHLRDPWSTIRRLSSLLKLGGAMIVSLPNVRNRHVIFPLLFKGKWQYTNSGILDRTHLRFFTKESAIDLIKSAGLNIDKIDITGGIARGKKAKILKMILPEWVLGLYVGQSLIRAIRK